ncbi:MAG TPA: NADH-quinone oxidoreductase subunit C [Candidatus Dormibacteraeota bacterium]|jgi:NADH-quinone oxidoreductase subunit C|nr:NADH-quinone oxidoreductase subunit C [Candidatus Dormibacteraeota bacterium]
MSKKKATKSTLEPLTVARGVGAGDDWVTVEVGDLREAMATLKSDGYKAYGFVTCVDHLPAEPRFELIYQVRDMDRKRQMRVRTFLPADQPSAPTVSDIYPPANWDERETFDLFGIDFEGHPDLTRILLPDDWVGHPLRRDYPVGGETVDFSEDHATWQTAPERA